MSVPKLKLIKEEKYMANPLVTRQTTWHWQGLEQNVFLLCSTSRVSNPPETVVFLCDSSGEPMMDREVRRTNIMNRDHEIYMAALALEGVFERDLP